MAQRFLNQKLGKRTSRRNELAKAKQQLKKPGWNQNPRGPK